MATIKIQYNLLGSIPEMDKYRLELPAMLKEFERTQENHLGTVLMYCAQHFYGLVFGKSFDNAKQLIDVLRTVDEDLKFK